MGTKADVILVQFDFAYLYDSAVSGDLANLFNLHLFDPPVRKQPADFMPLSKNENLALDQYKFCDPPVFDLHDGKIVLFVRNFSEFEHSVFLSGTYLEGSLKFEFISFSILSCKSVKFHFGSKKNARFCLEFQHVDRPFKHSYSLHELEHPFILPEMETVLSQ